MAHDTPSKATDPLNRIARSADVGNNQLDVSVSEGSLVGQGSGPMRRRWRTSIQFTANDGGNNTGDIVELKLDGTDNICELEDPMIRLILNRHLEEV